MNSTEIESGKESAMNGNLFPGDQQLCTAKVLIVDDEEAYIRTLEWALRQGKFANFRSVRDSKRVAEEFKQYQPDLVLLDLNMPGLDGFAVLEQIRKIVPPGEFLPVLVLTGYNTAEARNRALAAGASHFLP